MDHKLLKAVAVAEIAVEEIAYTLPLGPYTLIYPTTKTRYMNHNNRFSKRSIIYHVLQCVMFYNNHPHILMNKPYVYSWSIL